MQGCGVTQMANEVHEIRRLVPAAETIDPGLFARRRAHVMAGLDPIIPKGVVAAGNGFFRAAGARADGWDKPGHDALGQAPTYLTLSAGRSNSRIS